jgi:hypothetical protein
LRNFCKLPWREVKNLVQFSFSTFCSSTFKTVIESATAFVYPKTKHFFNNEDNLWIHNKFGTKSLHLKIQSVQNSYKILPKLFTNFEKQNKFKIVCNNLVATRIQNKLIRHPKKHIPICVSYNLSHAIAYLVLQPTW